MVENFLAGLKGARGPFFVGNDVALRLGYTDPQKAIKMHIDDEDKLTRQIVVSSSIFFG